MITVATKRDSERLRYILGKLYARSYQSDMDEFIRMQLRHLERLEERKGIILNKSEKRIFKKLVYRLWKHGGKWEKENWEYRILMLAMLKLLETD